MSFNIDDHESPVVYVFKIYRKPGVPQIVATNMYFYLLFDQHWNQFVSSKVNYIKLGHESLHACARSQKRAGKVNGRGFIGYPKGRNRDIKLAN